MIIKVLSENTSSMDSLGCEHGLSLYIKTNKHKVLFDTGASSLFMQNAQKMRVDLSKVDIVVISHGHNDHAGGLETFLRINKTAKIYLQEKAFGDYYSQRPDNEKKYIGIDKNLFSHGQIVLVKDRLIIDDELELFANVTQNRLSPSGNKTLYKKEEGEFFPDDFLHEQNLVIREDDKIVLIAGCAHNGIVNILDCFYKENGCMPTHVIGGLHLYNPAFKVNEDESVISEIAKQLLQSKARFYTCHCTGVAPYEQLEEQMGSKNIAYLSTGNQLII